MRVENLTALQELFAQHYAGSRNGTRAYIAAGGSEKGAAASGSRMLTLGKVKERIADLTEGTLRHVKLDGEMVILGLMRIAFGDIRDVVSWDGESFTLNPSKGMTVDAVHTIKKIKWKQEREWRGHGEDAEPWEVQTAEVEYADRLGALRLLMEYTGLTKKDDDDGSPQTFAGHPIQVVVNQLTAHFDLTELKRLDDLLEREAMTIDHQEVSDGSVTDS